MERDDGTVPGERHSTQVINERGVDFCNECARDVPLCVSYSLFELVQRERRKM